MNQGRSRDKVDTGNPKRQLMEKEYKASSFHFRHALETLQAKFRKHKHHN